MIKELRLGNWVMDIIGDIQQVFTLHGNVNDDYPMQMNGYDGNAGIQPDNEDNFKPIELTEEWLVEFGFEKIPNSSMVQFWEIGTFKLYHEYYYTGYIELSNYYDIVGSSTEIKHVHQLQNLYFALTSEELTIKQP